MCKQHCVARSRLETRVGTANVGAGHSFGLVLWVAGDRLRAHCRLPKRAGILVKSAPKTELELCPELIPHTIEV